MFREKGVIIEVSGESKEAVEISSAALRLGFRTFLCEEPPEGLKEQAGVTIYSPGSCGDILLLTEKEVEGLGEEGVEGRFAVYLEVERKEDERKVLEASRRGAEAVLVETRDWKIIPLENLIAELHKEETKLLARIEDVTEVETMFSILELGVDGIVFSPTKPEELEKLAEALRMPRGIELLPARVVEVRDAGVGDRVCVDTASILKLDEGMLIGSQSNVLFFILGETIESKFSAPRPFRVNAGPVHNYILLPDGRTKYLIELEGGSEVLLVDSIGAPRKVTVGRVKIERRPLALVKVECGEMEGHILVQKAETIRFMKTGGEVVSVT
ncbi:MAG: 3-dehydroquinate synthase II, partial [Candidatus Bathyarchaeia archaeon]